VKGRCFWNGLGQRGFLSLRDPSDPGTGLMGHPMFELRNGEDYFFSVCFTSKGVTSPDLISTSTVFSKDS